jgi:hypothetical protein
VCRIPPPARLKPAAVSFSGLLGCTSFRLESANSQAGDVLSNGDDEYAIRLSQMDETVWEVGY